MNFKIDFMKHYKKFFIYSSVLSIIGILTIAIFQMNYGVDFKAGTTLDITLGQRTEKANVEEIIRTTLPDVKDVILTLGSNNERVTARFDEVLNQQETNKVISAFEDKFGQQVTYEENTVDVTMAKELATKAILAVLYASIGIIIYVSIRFEWRFAVAAIVALLHDALITVSIFSIFRLEVNLPFVAAVLTIIGYSINDTIVIFDRVRENLRFAKVKSFRDLVELVNRSIWQTMTRSINTVITVLFAAAALFIFGSEAIRLFSLAMMVGLVCGVYSSILIACPIWLLLKNNSLNSKKAASSIAKP
ncbi:MAG: protein translocase subunit SecF [Paenibacillaceae bacterium]